MAHEDKQGMHPLSLGNTRVC